jgi:hypothetical protein
VEIGQCTELKTLRFTDNNLEGPILSEIGQLTEFDKDDVSWCQYSG